MREYGLTPEERWRIADLERRIEEDDDVDAMVEWAAFWAFNKRQWPLSDDQKEKVLEYYQAGVDCGNPLACLNLGAIYNEGILVKRDYDKSARLYRIAADSDDDPGISAMAITNLGYYYYYDYAGKQDYQKAFNCFLQGALRYGNANAYYKLGDMYRYGYFVDKDDKMAFEMYMKAFNCEEDGNFFKAEIGYRLGQCFLYGIGCGKDPYAALTLLQISQRHYYEKIRRRDERAKTQLKKVMSLMDEAELEIARSLDIQDEDAQEQVHIKDVFWQMPEESQSHDDKDLTRDEAEDVLWQTPEESQGGANIERDEPEDTVWKTPEGSYDAGENEPEQDGAGHEPGEDGPSPYGLGDTEKE